jgi:hypothetical protein
MATIFEQLAPYAGMTVVPGVTVGRLNYANQQDTFSDSVFTTAARTVPANQELQFFSVAITETGQGWSTGLTLSQTNSRFSKGQPPANQCLVATQFGVGVYYTDDINPANSQDITLPSERDLYAIIQNFSWDLQIGRGITRTIGSLLEYPDLGGAWATASSGAAGNGGRAQNGVPACYQVKLPIPIIFPPLVNVGITAKCGNAFTLLDAAETTNIVVRVTLGGFLMTMPV